MTTIATPRQRLHEQGYCLIKGVLPPELLALAQQVLESLVEEFIARWRRQGLLADDPVERRFRHRLLAAWEAAGRPHHERGARGELVCLAPERMYRILTHPALVDLAAELLDVDAVVSHEIWNSRHKAPQQRFTDTPWHQDAQYFREQAHRPMVNLWWPLHAVDADSSCLAVSPDVHRRGRLFDRYDDPTGFIGISPEVAAELNEVAVAMEPGDILAFTNLTPHRALPNRSDGIRWSMDLRFAAHGDEDRWPLGGGIVARHPDPEQLTGFDRWLEARGVRFRW